MGNVKKGIGVFFWFLSLISVCAIVAWCWFNTDFFKGDEKKEEKNIPDDIPVIQWNNDAPEKSYEELSVLLSDLESEIAVVNCNTNPEWEDVCLENFWVESFNITGVSGGNVKTLTFKFRDDAKDNKAMQSEIDKEVSGIISLIPKNADSYEKVLIIHDELIKRITYDESKNLAHSHDIYGALVEHKAVCQGYTYAMMYISAKIGLECEEISSKTHIWNKIPEFDSGECYIDITWDDTDRTDSKGKPYVIHDHFGLTKKEIEELSEHRPLESEKDISDKNSVGDNFYRKNGWYIPKGDTAVLEIAVKQQLESDSNIIELRFEDSSDYSSANETVNEMLRRMGYKDGYISWTYDALNIYTIGLYPPDEQ